MKKSIILVSMLVAMLIAFAFCGGTTPDNTVNNTEITGTPSVTDTPTKYDPLFADESPAIYNNIWIEADKDLGFDTVAGITKIDNSGDKIVATIKMFYGLPWGNGWGQDKKTLSIRQGDNKFKCLGGTVLDFSGASFYHYQGFPHLTFDKAEFEAGLAKLSDDEKKFVASCYSNDLQPVMNKYRMEGVILKSAKITDAEKELVKKYYVKDGEKYKLNAPGDDHMALVDVLAKVAPDSNLPDMTYDYKKYYILNYDIELCVEQAGGLKKENVIKLQLLLAKAGLFRPLVWEEYFEKKNANGVEFNIEQPFNLKEACSNGCLDFKNVWVKK